MNARFTAFSISSTDMKMMMALRRVRTPMTPIMNSTAEKNSDSVSILPPSAEDHCPDDRREQQNARQLERQQVLREQRLRDGRDGSFLRHFTRHEAGRQRQLVR